ncbi:MAG: SDR family oxidoreductase [Pseudomonadota bacterium]
MTDARQPSVHELMRLDGETALILGASGGLGAVIAARLAEAGARVAAHGFSNAAGAEAAARAAAERGVEAAPVIGNVADPDGAEAVFAACEDALGPASVLVNCAALQPVHPLTEMSFEDWTTVSRANLDGMFLATQTAARRAIDRGAACAIVNIASVEAFAPAVGHAHYCASKAAMVMFTKSAAVEFGAHGVRVNAVAPGLIARDGLEEAWPDGVARWRAAAPMGRMGQALEVADAVLFLCAPASRWVTGETLIVDGGVAASPTW